jgi:hypothetical protein
MFRKIKVKNNVGQYEGGNEQIRIEEDLIILFDYDCPSDYVLIYTADNGKEKKSGTIKNKQIMLPAAFIKVGKISLKVDVIVMNEIDKTILIEDLFVFEHNYKIELIPQVKVLTDLVERLQEKCDILIELVGGLYDINLGDKL